MKELLVEEVKANKDLVKKGGCKIPLIQLEGEQYSSDHIAVSFDKDDNPCGNNNDDDKIVYYRIYKLVPIRKDLTDTTIYAPSNHASYNRKFSSFDSLVNEFNRKKGDYARYD